MKEYYLVTIGEGYDERPWGIIECIKDNDPSKEGIWIWGSKDHSAIGFVNKKIDGSIPREEFKEIPIEKYLAFKLSGNEEHLK